MRSEHAVERRLRAARLPARKTLSQFDWRRAHGLERARVEELARCAWVDSARNVVLVGPVSTGKTHLATALGIEAIKRGHNVLFFRASDLVRALTEARDGRVLSRLQDRLRRASLLLLDELGFVPFEKAGGELLFDVLSARHERAATVITSNLCFQRVEPCLRRRQANRRPARSTRPARRCPRDPRSRRPRWPRPKTQRPGRGAGAAFAVKISAAAPAGWVTF